MQLSEAMDVNRNALLELKKRFDSINIVDVGCARGSLLKYTKRIFSDVFSIGIDPLNHEFERGNYNHFIQCAIDNVGSDDQVMSFYVNQDDQASSLLQMDFANISSDLDERDSKYYIRWAQNLKILREIEINVKSLKTILDEINFPGKIHLLKIDAEGKDLDVVKSLGDHASRVIFVSLECSSHKNDSIKIFKNGCHINDVIPYMNSIGFEVFENFDCEEDPNNLTQMSDIVFVNKSLLT
jgi:FkbM family methyltransferase